MGRDLGKPVVGSAKTFCAPGPVERWPAPGEAGDCLRVVLSMWPHEGVQMPSSR